MFSTPRVFFFFSFRVEIWNVDIDKRERESSNNVPTRTSFHGSFSFPCSFPHRLIQFFASRRYLLVLIAPHCSRYSSAATPFPGRAREKKGGGEGRAQREEKKAKKNLFAVHPRHFTREHFAAVSVTRCTFLLARVLVYFFSCLLSFFLPFFLSLFFRVPGTSSVIHAAHCTSSVAANAPRPLSPRMQFLQWLSILQTDTNGCHFLPPSSPFFLASN